MKSKYTNVLCHVAGNLDDGMVGVLVAGSWSGDERGEGSFVAVAQSHATLIRARLMEGISSFRSPDGVRWYMKDSDTGELIATIYRGAEGGVSTLVAGKDD